MSEIEIKNELKMQGLVEVQGNSYQHPVSDVQPTRHTKRNSSRLFEGDSGPVCLQSVEVLQLQQVWPYKPTL